MLPTAWPGAVSRPSDPYRQAWWSVLSGRRLTHGLWCHDDAHRGSAEDGVYTHMTEGRGSAAPAGARWQVQTHLPRFLMSQSQK